MTITEKAAYLRGLVEGQGLDSEAGEGKLWHVLSEIVSDLAEEITELRGRDEELADSLSDLEIRQDYLEEFLQEDGFDTDDREEDDYYPFGASHARTADDETEDPEEEDPDADEEDDWDSEVFYEVECPNCLERIEFGDDALEQGSISCPNCGAMLEFEIPDDSEEKTAEKDGLPTDHQTES